MANKINSSDEKNDSRSSEITLDNAIKTYFEITKNHDDRLSKEKVEIILGFKSHPEIVKYLESLGVKYGKDLRVKDEKSKGAYTGIKLKEVSSVSKNPEKLSNKSIVAYKNQLKI